MFRTPPTKMSMPAMPTTTVHHAPPPLRHTYHVDVTLRDDLVAGGAMVARMHVSRHHLTMQLQNGRTAEFNLWRMQVVVPPQPAHAVVLCDFGNRDTAMGLWILFSCAPVRDTWLGIFCRTCAPVVDDAGAKIAFADREGRGMTRASTEGCLLARGGRLGVIRECS